jgi:YVTN family beta-propeller protein
VIDRASFKATGKIITGRGAHNFLPLGDGQRLLVSNRAEDTISILDMNSLKVLETFKAPGSPDCMELTRDGKTLWYTARVAKKVVAIDMETKQVTGSVPVGRSPHGIYYYDHAPRK